jgi:hypothetical protein
MTKEEFKNLWNHPEEIEVLQFDHIVKSNAIAFTVRVNPNAFVITPSPSSVYIVAVDFRTREISGGIPIQPK